MSILQVVKNESDLNAQNFALCKSNLLKENTGTEGFPGLKIPEPVRNLIKH